MSEEAKTLPTIGYSGVIAVPKRPGRGRNDQDSETWLHSGHILLHHIETKTQKTHGSKVKLRAAVKTGLKILVSEHPESMKQQAVTELNQLKYALGGYWKQWLASIRHQKFEVKNRTTITFNLEPELQKLLGFEHFNEKAMNTLQSAVLSLQLNSLSDLYDLQEFLAKYQAKREHHKQIGRSEEAESSLTSITIRQLMKLFNNAKLEDFEALKSYFSHRQKIINKAEKFNQIRSMISHYDPVNQHPVLFIDELRQFVET